MFKFLKTRTAIIFITGCIFVLGMGYEIDMNRDGIALAFGIIALCLGIAAFASALSSAPSLPYLDD